MTRGRECLGAPAQPCLTPQHRLSTRSCSQPHGEAASDGEGTRCQGTLPPAQSWFSLPVILPLPCGLVGSVQTPADASAEALPLSSPCPGSRHRQRRLGTSPIPVRCLSALPLEPHDAEAQTQHCRGCLLLRARLILAGARAGQHGSQGSTAQGGRAVVAGPAERFVWEGSITQAKTPTDTLPNLDPVAKPKNASCSRVLSPRRALRGHGGLTGPGCACVRPAPSVTL